jgi:hypothetical protein
LILTFGLAASKSATVLAQKAFPSPVVELCHMVISTGPPESEPASPPSPPPPHALSALATSSAEHAARIFLGFMG